MVAVVVVVVVLVVVVCLYRSQGDPDVATGTRSAIASPAALQHATIVRTRARRSTNGGRIKEARQKVQISQRRKVDACWIRCLSGVTASRRAESVVPETMGFIIPVCARTARRRPPGWYDRLRTRASWHVEAGART